jgi:hypothetical protein
MIRPVSPVAPVQHYKCLPVCARLSTRLSTNHLPEAASTVFAANWRTFDRSGKAILIDGSKLILVVAHTHN